MSTPNEPTAALTPTVVDPKTETAVSAPTPADLSTKTWFRGVPPDDKLNRMYGFAMAIKDAVFLNPIVRGNAASVFYMVSIGEDLGLQWTHATRSLYPISRKTNDGEQIRVGIQGDIALALLQARKFKIKFKESTEEVATVWMERPDGTMDFEDSFTVLEAQRLDLLKKPNWNYRKDMLRWRAIMRVARVVAADVLGGMYLPDELEDGFGVSEPTARREDLFPVGEIPKAPTPEVPTPPTPPTPAAETKPPEPEPQPAKDETKPEPVRTDAPPKPSTAAAEPEAPAGPVAVPDPDGREPLKAMHERLALIYDKKSPDANKKLFGAFIKGFLNVKAMPPMSEAVYRPIYRILENILTAYPHKLAENANGLGLTVGVAWRETKKQLEEWAISDRCKDAFFDVMLAFNHSDSGGKNTCEYVEGLGIDKLAEGDMFAYLQVARRTNDAYMLLDQAEATKSKVSEIVSRWGIDVDTAPVAGIVALLKGGAVKPAEPAPAPAAAAAPVPAEEEAQGEEIDEVLDLFNMSEEE